MLLRRRIRHRCSCQRSDAVLNLGLWHPMLLHERDPCFDVGEFGLESRTGSGRETLGNEVTGVARRDEEGVAAETICGLDMLRREEGLEM